jgi:hypothetical protein
MMDQEYSLIENYTLGLYFENTNVANATDVEMRVRGGSLSILGSVPLSKLENLPVEIQGVPEITAHTRSVVSSVADNTRVTVVTQAFVTDSFEKVIKISVSGSISAKYYLQLNTGSGYNDIDTRRATPEKNLEFNFSDAPFALNSGDSIRVQVEHFNTGVLEAFEGTIYGGA